MTLPSWSEAAPSRLVERAEALERAPITSAPRTAAILWTIGPSGLIDERSTLRSFGSIAVARSVVEPVWRSIDDLRATLILPDGSERPCREQRGQEAWICPAHAGQNVRVERAERSFGDGARTCFAFDAPIEGARLRLAFPSAPDAERAAIVRAGMTLRGARNHPTREGVWWAVRAGGETIAERSLGPMETSWEEIPIEAISAETIEFEARSLGPMEKTLCVGAWERM